MAKIVNTIMVIILQKEIPVMSNKKVLIVIDMQNDFCPGGNLPVKDGDEIIPVVNEIMKSFAVVVATQDWHPQNHVSFASNHKGKKIYDTIIHDGIDQALWPDHCVAGTKGADFYKGLDTDRFNLILRKGTNPAIDSYSAFMENDKKTETGLHGYIKALNPAKVFVCGLATDYCVYYTAMDSVKYGFETHVLIDACRGIDEPAGSINAVIADMKKSGIKIENVNEL